MEIISVTDELSIELGTDSWRLVRDENQGVTLLSLVEFNGVGIKLHPNYGCARRLGREELLTRDIARVSLGWEPRKKNWQLGLLVYVRHNIADSGELSWCELVAWEPGDAPALRASAQQAGENLARLLGRPFQLVEPTADLETVLGDPPIDATQPSMQTNPVAVRPVSVKPLPIEMGDWSLHAAGEGMILRLTRQWVMGHSFRTLFFIIFFILFLVLAIGSQTAGLAPVTPEWLPFVALGMALLLAFSAARNLWQVVARQQVIFDEQNREVRSEGSLTHFIDWRIPFDHIEYILVSQETPRSQGRRSREDPMHIQQEAWIHLYADQQFYLIGEIGKIDGKSWNWETVRRHTHTDRRRALDLTEYDTPLHHAVKQISDKLAVEAYVDIR